MTASTRRAALGVILAAPLASVPAVAADPHVAREAKARALYQRHRETEWGWSEPSFCPACIEASAAHHDVMLFASEASHMPPPCTLAGLGVLALSIALSEEQGFSAPSMDCTDWHFHALLQAVLSVTGVAMPPDYRGLVYHPREDGLCG